MTLHTAYILLGGNLGEVKKTFKRAHILLNALGNITLKSGVYRSEPWHMDSENQFFNQAIALQTSLEPQLLLQELLSIEQKLGRKRKAKTSGYADRVLDLDMLFFDDLVLKSEYLVLPHPRLHQRMFTLLPLQEIAGELMHPVLQKDINGLVKLCEDSSRVKLENGA